MRFDTSNLPAEIAGPVLYFTFKNTGFVRNNVPKNEIHPKILSLLNGTYRFHVWANDDLNVTVFQQFNDCHQTLIFVDNGDIIEYKNEEYSRIV